MTRGSKASTIPLLLCALGALSKPVAQQRSMSASTGSISGVVLAAGTVDPVRGVRVLLTSGDSPSRGAVTADDGHFAFTGLPDGDFKLSASKVGYLNTEYGQTRPGRPGTTVHVTAGQAVRDLMLRLPRGSVLTGTIRDDTGAAFPGATVIVFKRIRAASDERLSQVAQVDGDDRGVYRVFGLPAGEYILGVQPRPSVGDLRAATPAIDLDGLKVDSLVARQLARFLAAVPPDEPATAYAPVYYPGTAVLADATTVRVGPGEESAGIDVTVSLVPAVKVEGKVTSLGVAQLGARVTLSPAQSSVGIREVANTKADGTFEFVRVPPGDYELSARTAPGAERVFYGHATVTVNGQPVVLAEIALESGGTVSGSVAFDATTPAVPTALASTEVLLEPVSSGGLVLADPARTKVQSSGTFALPGVAPGRYLVRVFTPSGEAAVSAMVKGRDALDLPFDLGQSESVTDVRVTLSSKLTEFSGTVRNGAGAPAADCTVVVFADDPTFWTPGSRRIQTVRPNTAGSYVIRNLPAGTYRVALASDIEPDAWFDPAVLETLIPVSTAVRVDAGAHVRLDLRIGG